MDFVLLITSMTVFRCSLLLFSFSIRFFMIYSYLSLTFSVSVNWARRSANFVFFWSCAFCSNLSSVSLFISNLSRSLNYFRLRTLASVIDSSSASILRICSDACFDCLRNLLLSSRIAMLRARSSWSSFCNKAQFLHSSCRVLFFRFGENANFYSLWLEKMAQPWL